MVGNSDIKANSVQLLLQLPTRTELGKRKMVITVHTPEPKERTKTESVNNGQVNTDQWLPKVQDGFLIYKRLDLEMEFAKSDEDLRKGCG